MVTHLIRKCLKEAIEGEPQQFKNDLGVSFGIGIVIKISWRLAHYFLNRNKP